MNIIDSQDGIIKVSEIKDFSLEKTLESGQCFRFIKDGNAYTIQSGDRVVKAMQVNNSEVWFMGNKPDVESYWIHYLNISGDYSPISKVVESKTFLREAAEYSKGLKIMNQDPWETLVCFIISQRNNIPKIKSTVSKLCHACGKEIEFDSHKFHAFPSPDELLVGIEKYGASLSLGYRIEYLWEAASAVRSGRLKINSLTAQSGCEYSEAILKLMGIRGVGPKVANCVALFGLGHTRAFPIDVWIERVIRDEFDGYLDVSEFGEYAGIVQQYMFYYGRHIGK